MLFLHDKANIRTALKLGFRNSIQQGKVVAERAVVSNGHRVELDRVDGFGIEQHMADRAVFTAQAKLAECRQFLHNPIGFRVIKMACIALGTKAVFPYMCLRAGDDLAAFAVFRVRVVLVREYHGIFMVIRVKVAIRLAALLTVCRFHAVCRAAGMLAAVMAERADALFVKLVRKNRDHITAVPMFFVRCLGGIYVVSRPRFIVIIRSFFAIVLSANDAIRRLAAGRLPCRIMSLCRDNRSCGNHI